MGSAQAFELAVKEVERRRARVAAAADGFLKGTVPLDDLRLESAAMSAAEKARDGALRECREPSSYDAAKREVGGLTEEQRKRLRLARSFVDEQSTRRYTTRGWTRRMLRPSRRPRRCHRRALFGARSRRSKPTSA